MNEKGKELVESFELDHTKVKAPFVRQCTVYKGDKGDIVTKLENVKIENAIGLINAMRGFSE